jgi:MFS family permease
MHRRELRRDCVGSRIGFAGAACSLAVFAASASPIPLYELYRRTDGLRHADLSLTAVAYFVAVMAALLIYGRLSNHVGRRPVALAALPITAAGTPVLTQVHSVAPLIAGRVLQGIGCGLASSALAEYGPAPRTLVYLIAAVVLGACAVLIVAARETVVRTPGAIAGLRPQVSVPPATHGFLFAPTLGRRRF